MTRRRLSGSRASSAKSKLYATSITVPEVSGLSRKPTKRSQARPSRRPDAPWLWLAGSAFALIVVGAFIWMRNASPPPSSSAGVIPDGAAAPTVAQPSTTGQSISLGQFSGAKVVVYFYEGAG